MQAIIDLLDKKIVIMSTKRAGEQKESKPCSNSISYYNGCINTYTDIRDILVMLTELEVITYEDEGVDIGIDEEGNYV